MTPSQQDVAHRLGLKINGSERAIDSSISSVADLFQELSAVRRHGNVSAEIAQPVCDELATAMQLMVSARGRIVAAHKNMTVGAAEMSFEPFVGEGGMKPKPPTGELEDGRDTVTPLRAA